MARAATVRPVRRTNNVMDAFRPIMAGVGGGRLYEQAGRMTSEGK